jgi:hypothetical protein
VPVQADLQIAATIVLIQIKLRPAAARMIQKAFAIGQGRSAESLHSRVARQWRSHTIFARSDEDAA